LQTRKWQKDGQDHYSTEVVVRGFNGTMQMLDSRGGEGGFAPAQQSAPAQQKPRPHPLWLMTVLMMISRSKKHLRV